MPCFHGDSPIALAAAAASALRFFGTARSEFTLSKVNYGYFVSGLSHLD
jgi:hypothetical protein